MARITPSNGCACMRSQYGRRCRSARRSLGSSPTGKLVRIHTNMCGTRPVRGAPKRRRQPAGEGKRHAVAVGPRSSASKKTSLQSRRHRNRQFLTYGLARRRPRSRAPALCRFGPSRSPSGRQKRRSRNIRSLDSSRQLLALESILQGTGLACVLEIDRYTCREPGCAHQLQNNNPYSVQDGAGQQLMCWFHGLLICWLPAGLSVANPTKKALLIGRGSAAANGTASRKLILLLLRTPTTLAENKNKPPRVHHVSPLPR